MRVLALDTSTPTCAVAVIDGERVLAQDDRPTEGRHGEVLLPRVRDVLAAAGLLPADLALIAVGSGPGSFTGLRIGLASAKGLALALSVPLRAVCSLRALAAGLPVRPGSLRAAALDAGKGEVFVAAFDGEDPLNPPLLPPLRATPEQAASRLSALLAPGIRGLLLCGPGARRYPALGTLQATGAQLVDPALDVPAGRNVAQLALALYRAEGPSDLATLAPNYLRGSDARLPARTPSTE